MPSALVSALSAPIREVRSMVGPGWSGASGEPAAILAAAGEVLADVATATGVATQRTGGQWRGAGADAAAAYVASTVAAVDELASRTGELSRAAGAAGAAVAEAGSRLDQIVAGFETRAAALEPDLDTPGVAEDLLAEARRALREAIAVIEDLRAELDAQTAAVATPTGASAPTTPAGFSAPALPSGSGSSGLGSSGLGSSVSGQGAPAGSGSGLAGLASLVSGRRAAAPGPLPEARAFGDGVAVRLPDGRTVTAPNQVAADAVRNALTQLGVPYQWGGTTPGVGLDCSGLTQWAYDQAGLNLPRLAQEQDIGQAVNAAALLPGDLAVWDGHVAMVVGDGTMIEAGDPVKLSPIRTTNAGQGFQGFWRPTG
jgi:cell wall-associated NlpC family hydrolase